MNTIVPTPVRKSTPDILKADSPSRNVTSFEQTSNIKSNEDSLPSFDQDDLTTSQKLYNMTSYGLSKTVDGKYFL